MICLPTKLTAKIQQAENERQKISLYIRGLLESFLSVYDHEYNPDIWKVVFYPDGTATIERTESD